ncbi:KUP/HAK/KT family potassium transporter [Segatella paludivivens]|uniref:KUP/HAK/KT family potassium transporter n=1 Tax=Segatella paludivivens TaxID=185294 RepID=UPI0003812D43|nr:KUP/HAK/KT family potassium transporter [Segatella paludivivens]
MDNSKSSLSSRITMMGLLVTLGIVFGDIGTSPLYVMKTIIRANPTYDANFIIGAVSCIIWTLTLQTTLKYVVVALRADNHGEGGILALYALLHKYRWKSLYVVAIIGAATLVADGIITPAITVTSAIEGLQVINPSTPVLPICIGIISILFLIQRFGTSVIGRSFGPIMFFWFLMLGVLGVMNIHYDLDIFRAFNPYYAIHVLVAYPETSLILGAVFLCTTGAEALYSDLGHCGRKNIRISWIYVKAMLILNYLGQGAWAISRIGNDMNGINPFYAIIPKDFLVFAIVMATMAAVIASQALISGCYTIFSEAINLNFWPRLKIKHPTNFKGQIYIPLVNNFLFCFCVFTLILFQTSDNMEAAYGLSITITMLMTTILLGVYLWHGNVTRIFAIPFLVVFMTIESCFLMANVAKFMRGGWFTLLIASFFFIIMMVWYKASKTRQRNLKLVKIKDYLPVIKDLKADTTIAKYASNLVFINWAQKEDEVEDKLIYSILRKQPKRADHYWLIHLDMVDEPQTLEYTVDTLLEDTVFNIRIKIGFRVQPFVSQFLRQIIHDMTERNEVSITSGYPSLRQHGILGDFCFVVIHRIFYPASSVSSFEQFVMNLYALARHMAIPEQHWLGLDTSNVVVENVPLIINKNCQQKIVRVEK